MLKTFANLPPRKRIGILGIILGIIAVFIGNPMDNTKASVNIKELSMSDHEVNTIDAIQLAEWIIQGKMDYRLVDLRSQEDYDEYNIPMSECIPMDGITKSDLKRNEKIIVYADNDIVASKAWFILKSSRFKSVSILKNGMDGWKNDVVFPTCNCGVNPSVEQKQLHAKKSEVASFFGGLLQDNGVSDSKVKKDLPKLTAPKSIQLKSVRKKPARQGC